MRTVIFTGAGAGKSDGAPLQTELFQTFFAYTPASEPRRLLQSEVSSLFATVFGADTGSGARSLPTFEEALGVLELAITREEGLQGLGDSQSLGDLRRLRRQLILALAATIARDRPIAGSVHARLIETLRATNWLSKIVFVTTNYDTFLDDAIEAGAIVENRGTGSLVDYGFGGLVTTAHTPFADPRKFPLLKIHGSLNWLYCPVCNVLDITYATDGVTRLIDDVEGARCPKCEALRTPVIVPPSYYKDVFSVHLSVVWTRAYHDLQDAECLVFCGYSFPDADMHVKYLIKRAQLNRDSVNHPLKVVLVNHYAGKHDALARSEFDRFARFIGESEIWDTRLSFEQFAADPASVLAHVESL